MTVVMSKYMDVVMDKIERNTIARMAVSHALVGAAVTAWSFKVLYPLLSETGKTLKERVRGGTRSSSLPVSLPDQDQSTVSRDLFQVPNTYRLSSCSCVLHYSGTDHLPCRIRGDCW